MSTSALAQGQGQFGGGQRMNPEEMAQRRTEMLVQQLGLNDEQKAAVLELTKKQMSQMRGPRPQNADASQSATTDQPNDKKADKKNKKEKKADKKAEKKNESAERPARNENAQRGQRGDRPDFQAMQQEYNAEMKKILTEEQYAKYEEMQKNMRQRGFGQRGGQRGRGQGGPRGNRPQNND